MWSEVNKKREFCILGTRFFLHKLLTILDHIQKNFTIQVVSDKDIPKWDGVQIVQEV